MNDAERAVAALRAGECVILPTDTVYGLCVSPDREVDVRRMYELKGREEAKPTALLAADVDALLQALPELSGETARVLRALLPGAYTLVLPNPRRRFAWLAGRAPDAIGVRVPTLTGDGAAVMRDVGVVAATSANLAGGPDPKTVDELDPRLRERVAAVIDGGELPGTPSTVLDLTGPEPHVIREGAVGAAIALERVAAALR
jgi:L-threonylcarbamoyladenylate synthase